MNKFKLIIIGLFISSSLIANDSVGSEASHFIGGAVMAGGITAIVDKYYPEYKNDRFLIGFGISSTAIIAEQGVEYALRGNAKGQLLDAGSHILGSALGSYLTDEFILTPIVDHEQIGVKVNYTF